MNQVAIALDGEFVMGECAQAGSPTYRCLFPAPSEAAAMPNCAEAGLLGVLPVRSNRAAPE